LRIVVGAAISLYLLLLLVTNLPASRRWIAHRGAAALSEKLQTRVEVGDADISLFNRVVLHDVSVEDQSKRPLLTAGTLAGKISLRPLMDGKVVLRSVSLLDAEVRIVKDSIDGPTNAQFILDAFKSEEQKPSTLDLQVRSLLLRRCRVSYDEAYAPETPEQFNKSHIALSDIDGNLSLKHLTPDSLSLRIRSLSAKEHSGFNLKQIACQIDANDQECSIENLLVELPHSKIDEKLVRLHYDSLNAPLASLAAEGSLTKATLSTDDVACFAPKLKNVHRTLTLSTDYNASKNGVACKNLRLRDAKNECAIDGDVSLAFNPGAAPTVDADLRKCNVDQAFSRQLIQTLAPNASSPLLANVPTIDYVGSVHYDAAGESTARGTLRSSAGDVSGDVAWENGAAGGTLQTQDLQLGKLLGRDDLPDHLTAEAEGSCTWTSNGLRSADGDINLKYAEYRGQRLTDISANGTLQGDHLAAALQSAMPGAALTANIDGTLKGNALTNVAVDADVQDLRLSTFGVGGEWGGSELSGRIATTLPSLSKESLRSLSGDVAVQDVTLTRNGQSVHVDELALRSNNGRGTIELKSDAADATIDGTLNPDFFKNATLALLDNCLPGIFPKPTQTSEGEAAFDVLLKRQDEIDQFVSLPLTLQSPLRLVGSLRGDGTAAELHAQTDSLQSGTFKFEDFRIDLNGQGNRVETLVQGNTRLKDNPVQVQTLLTAESGLMETALQWEGGLKELLSGNMVLQSVVQNAPSGERQLLSQLMPSQIRIGDSIWNASSGDILLGDKAVAIDNLRLSHADQSLNIAGRLSDNPLDSIVADLQKVEVAYIMSMVNFDAVEFSGEATGRLWFSKAHGEPQIKANVSVPEFNLNHKEIGDLRLNGGFDLAAKRILLDALIADSAGVGTVKGYVGLGEKALDLHIDNQALRINFLDKYVNGFFEGFSGRATGWCRVHGSFGGIDFEGEEIGRAHTKVIATGVDYNLTDGTIVMSDGEFAFKDCTLTDNHHGTAKMNGYLRHDYLKNLRYAFDADAEHLLVYDQPKTIDWPFYATAFGSGTLHLEGKSGEFRADVELTPERGTDFVYTIDSPDSPDAIDFVKYGPKYDDPIDSLSVQTIYSAADHEEEGATDIYLNLIIHTAPEANIKVVMDEKSGDYILVHGDGPIRANYYNKGPFRMYGTYTVQDGIYKMSIQDVIKKDFTLTQGGNIVFAGNPFDGDLDLQAVYTVNSASLSDLNLGNLSNNSLRVNCLLNFSGKVGNPIVSFDLDLPTVNEDENQMIRSLIASEEDMNMQIIYLLGFGRFYNSNYSSAGTSSAAGDQSAAAMKSFLSGMFSGQLNNMISNAVGNSNWTFGANIGTGSVGTNEMEVEGMLSGRLLNNRLRINGNIGYRENSVYNSNFIGDFDVEYLLTPKGSVSLKAYSETNDRYFTKSSLTTQGAGIQFKRDFSNLKDLFTRQRKNKKSAEKNK